MIQLTNSIDLQSALALALAIFILAGIPGPGILAVTSCALSSTFSASLYVISGVVFVHTIFFLVAIYGITLVTQFVDNGIIIVKTLGALYLVSLAVKLWLKATIKIENQDLESNNNNFGTFTTGFLITLCNPITIVFYVSLFPLFIEPSQLKINDLILIGIIITSVLSSVNIFYAYLASFAKSIFKSEIAMQNINRIAGMLMLMVAFLVVLV